MNLKIENPPVTLRELCLDKVMPLLQAISLREKDWLKERYVKNSA